MANTININVNKTDLGLNLVDNTSDLNKPISTATQVALNGKEDVANKSTSTSLGTSDTLYPTQNAVKVYTDNLLGNANALVYKGVIDCSTNPNYPSANAGELYIVSVAGKIGGASGINVEVGDMLICNNDSTASGNEATVGAYWNAIQKNIDGAVTGPASSVNNTVAVFDGTTGKLIKEGVITDNGTFVGVGTTSPQGKLHVNFSSPSIGEVLGHFSVDDDASTFLRILNSTAVDNLFEPMIYASQSSNKTPLAFVGSGTTDTGADALMSFDVRIGSGSVATRTAYQFSNYGSVLMAIKPNGNVGIGTITPTEKLHVAGNIIANNLSGTNTGDQDLSGYATKNITLDRKTASYTLVAGDNGKMIEMNVASANTLTIDSSIFSAGNQILISQYGAGQTTITAGAGVTLRSSGGKLKTSAQYSLVTIIAISSTEFYIAGDLTA
jgi:hypothetical protein